MPRTKKYSEQEVLEKAMNLFWKKGYETTSMQMLEKEMGINKFSIYSSFGSKDGLFVESMKFYRKRLNTITNKLQNSNNGIIGIKEYFYSFIDFSKENDLCKGCLITNTANEVDKDADQNILAQIVKFSTDVRQLFIKNLEQENTKATSEIQELGDYLIISMVGLSSASRIFNQKQLTNYIENIFKQL
ncbi:MULTISPECIES: TetR/AcrR family transcriptional regulator [Flavobacteriaceae]|uniref:TetR/AcrR family transcriptional regulator n=2 Tax=Flavobacteriales TaxID=200644 RepID=UPI001C07C79E|nr:TetR/AcrR family transcriptional regulator [Zobellia uliginosa]MBU2947017.1 TetR/AcrR family transcriptional regulator [Zobellia uliginosa]